MRPALILCATLGLVGLLSACKDKQHAGPPLTRPVLSVVVSPESVQTVGFAGTVEPRYRSDLGFRVLGRIVSRDANLADVVRKGQRLATLDPVAYQLAVRAAQADLASATAQLENATGTEARQRTLFQKNVTSQAEFDVVRQAQESAEAGVTRGKANLAKAEEQLGYTQLLADFDGVVTAVEAELGQVVQPGQTIISVARPDVREAVIDLPESIGRALKPGGRFEVTLQLDPSLRVAGSVREIAPQADPTTRTVRVRITLNKPPENFRLGTTVNAAIISRAPSGIVLPASAVLERDGKTMVWIVDPSAKTVSTLDVKVAARDGSSVEVLDGLTPGTRVVTAGVHSLSPGQAVKVSEEAVL